GREEKLAGYVDRAGNVAAPRPAPARARVLLSIARVHDLAGEISLTEDRRNLFRGGAKFRPRPWREDGLLRGHCTLLNRTSLVHPGVPSPVQHADLIVSVVPQSPPEARGELPASLIDGDDMGLISDPARRHGRCESIRRRDLGGDRIIGVCDVG